VIKRAITLTLLGGLGCSSLALAGIAGTGTALSVDGIAGLTPVQEHSCLAVWVPLDPAQALAGLKWYNNDGTAVFPRLLVAAGDGDTPGGLDDAQCLAQAVTGVSSGWSEVAFPTPVVSEGGGVFAMFEFPVGSEQTGEGDGGGAGIGYRLSADGLLGWASADGQAWVRMHPAARLAVQPVLVGAQSGMLAMSRSLFTPPATAETGPTTALLPALPNPFNPRTMIRFTLGQVGMVRLAVYNVRGERVKLLSEGSRGPGAHEVPWLGEDDRGRPAPSGTYLARLSCDDLVLSQRLLLVR